MGRRGLRLLKDYSYVKQSGRNYVVLDAVRHGAKETPLGEQGYVGYVEKPYTKPSIAITSVRVECTGLETVYSLTPKYSEAVYRCRGNMRVRRNKVHD